MDYFKLTRDFWDFSFENPEKIKPNHCALFLFIVEHCNRLGWVRKFHLPTTMAKDAIGIRSYNTYIQTLNDLVDFGFIEMLEKSKNQYSSNIIALSNFNKAHDKALDKALIKHVTKHSESTVQSIDSINKQYTNNNLQYNTVLLNEKKQPHTDSELSPTEIYEKAKTLIEQSAEPETKEQKKLRNYKSENEFLNDWNFAREKKLNVKSNIKYLTPIEKPIFKAICDTFTVDDIQNAIQGLMIQKNVFKSVLLRPKHLFENIELYSDAFINNIQLFNDQKKDE